MCIFKERLTELINRSNSALEEYRSKRDVVTAHQFEGFVNQAILAGHEIGVGRLFIQEFLLRNFSLQPTKYLQRRLGAVLRRRVEYGTYKLNNNLYSFKKEWINTWKDGWADLHYPICNLCKICCDGCCNVNGIKAVNMPNFLFLTFQAWLKYKTESWKCWLIVR